VLRPAAFLLALAVAASEASAERSSERLGGDVVPVFQEIRLSLDPADRSYSGRVVIELDVRSPVTSFRLHCDGPRLVDLRLTRGDRPLAASWRAIADDVVEVSGPGPFSPGPHTLSIAFENEFGTRSVGLYRVESGGDAYAFTQFEADDARRAFPCFDEPGFKLPFVITLTVPDDVTALANTPVASESRSDGRRTVVFARTKPLPTYLVAVAVGPFETVPVPGLPNARVVTPRGRSRLAALAAESLPPMLSALEEWFGRPHPFDKLDLVAVPEFWPGAMENPGLITFRDSALLFDPAATTAAQRRRFQQILAHELAHQWFGNLVTMEWWDDLWLNEAFADWLGNKISDRLHPELGGATSELRGAQRFLASDARPSTKPIRRTVTPGEELMEGVGLTYRKGSLVLGAFEQWVGEEAFRRGVNDYLAAHEWGSATAADLWSALDAATGQSVSTAMAGYLEQPGHPLIDFEIDGGRVVLRQSRFRFAVGGADDLRWRIPMVLRYSDGRSVRTRRLLLEGDELRLDLGGEIEWLVPNAGASGCYRWSLPADRLAALAAVADRELSPAERVELLGNSGALLDAGALGVVDYVGVLRRFAADPDPEVASAALSGLETVRTTFVTEELEEEFAQFVRVTLAPTLERIGMESRAGEDELTATLRASLLGWLGDHGRDPEVRAHGRRLADAYVADPSSVDPSLAAVCLSLAALDGDAALFETYRGRLESAEVPAERHRFLAALGAFRDPVLSERALAYALEGPLPSQEIGVIPRSLVETEPGRQLVFDWMTEHWDELADRLPPPSLARAPAYGGGCSAERLAAMLAFFEEPGRRVPGAERAIQSTETQVSDCLRQREAEGPALAKWLRAFAAPGPAAGSSATSRSSPRRP